MKKKFVLLLTAACLCLVYLTANAQQTDALDAIRQDPDKAGNVFYMYDHNIPPCAKAPRGYKPFYISHYGRHGARNHSSNKDFDVIYGLFSAARQRGLLTDRGAEFLSLYEKAYPVLRGRASDLCDLGFQQQYKISHNMYAAHRQIFNKKGARVDAVSTIVPRCILTMSAFTDQLLRENPKLEIYKQASESTMEYLNPFSLNNPDVHETDEGYNNKYAYWQKDFRAMCKEKLHPSEVFGPLIKDCSILDEFGKPLDLEMALFSIASNVQVNGQLKDSFWPFIPMEEICSIYECRNFRFYASKGADTLYQNGRQWAFVWRTMQDIIDKADSDIASGEYAARLRFGHDIIVMSLLVLLDVDGYNKPVGSISEVKDVFRSYDFPMSLNTQFVFYRNSRGDVLVRLLYNERDVALPIPDCGTPYFYRWSDFRDFALQRIALARSILATTQAPPKEK